MWLQGRPSSLRILLIAQMLTWLSSTLGASHAMPSKQEDRAFNDVRRELARRGIHYVIEEQPKRQRASFVDPGDSLTELFTRIAEAFDYRWEREADILRLHKRYSDIEDRPSFSADELQAAAADLLSIVQPHWVPPLTDGQPPDVRFVRSFTQQQLVAFGDRPVPVTTLPAGQQKLLYDCGASYFTVRAFPRLTALRSILTRPQAVRFVWGLVDPNSRRPDLICYYDEPGRRVAAISMQDPQRHYIARVPPRGYVSPVPISLPDLRRSSRQLPFKVSIDRQDATVGDVLEDINAQVSVPVSAPDYFRTRRVSVFVREVAAGQLLDAMGSVFGWEWDASSSGRVRLSRPRSVAPTWVTMQSAVWGALPKPLRAYLEPARDRAGWPDRAEAAALLVAQQFFKAVQNKLATPDGVRYEELGPQTQQLFLQWLTFDQLGQAFGWHSQSVPPWLMYPERTVLIASRQPSVRAADPAIAAELRNELAKHSKGEQITIRLRGPGSHGGITEIGFTLEATPEP